MIVTRCRCASTARNPRGGGACAASERATAAASDHSAQHRRDLRHGTGGMPFLGKPHSSLTLVLGKMGTLSRHRCKETSTNMNPRPGSPRLRCALALAVALAIGAAAGAGAYALTSHHSSTPSASPRGRAGAARLVHIDRRLAHAALQAGCAGRRRHHRPARARAAARRAASPSATPADRRRRRPKEPASRSTRRATSSRPSTSSTVPTSIKVTFQDGSTAKATLVGNPDKSTDTAVIHVDVPASQLHPLTLGNSSAVEPGQTRRGDRQPVRPDRDDDRRASSARRTGRSPRRTTSRSPARSRPMPRSTTATPAAR